MERRNKEMYSIIETKTRELSRLRNKINKYSKRLILESLMIAKESPIELELKKVSDNNIDTDPLIELAKDKFPSLYRRYHSLQEGYSRKVIELERLKAKLN